MTVKTWKWDTQPWLVSHTITKTAKLVPRNLEHKEIFWGNERKLVSPLFCAPWFCHFKSSVIFSCKQLCPCPAPAEDAAAFLLCIAFGFWSVWVWSCLVFQRKGASRWQLWLSLHFQSPWGATGQRFTVCCEEEQQGDRATPWASCTTSPSSFWRLVALPWLASLLILVASQRSWSLLQDCLWNVKERKNYLCLGFFSWALSPCLFLAMVCLYLLREKSIIVNSENIHYYLSLE